MAKTKSKKPPFIGTWRINEMELWDKATIDLLENGYIRFDKGEAGNLSLRGALILYLDFINLTLFLLRILGRRR